MFDVMALEFGDNRRETDLADACIDLANWEWRPALFLGVLRVSDARCQNA